MNTTHKSNSNFIKWDIESDFPIVCQACLSSLSSKIKMIKSEYEKECRICKRPFTVFKWRNTKSNKILCTEVCCLCSKVKNLCQSCCLDFDFGVEMELRDKFLKNKIEMPKEQGNRDFWAYKISQNLDRIELPYGNLNNIMLQLKEENDFGLSSYEDEGKGRYKKENYSCIGESKDDFNKKMKILTDNACNDMLFVEKEGIEENYHIKLRDFKFYSNAKGCYLRK